MDDCVDERVLCMIQKKSKSTSWPIGVWVCVGGVGGVVRMETESRYLRVQVLWRGWEKHTPAVIPWIFFFAFVSIKKLRTKVCHASNAYPITENTRTKNTRTDRPRVFPWLWRQIPIYNPHTAEKDKEGCAAVNDFNCFVGFERELSIFGVAKDARQTNLYLFRRTNAISLLFLRCSLVSFWGSLCASSLALRVSRIISHCVISTHMIQV